MTNSTITPTDVKIGGTIEYKKIEPFLLSLEDKIKKYKFMKVEITAFLDGLTKGNWTVKDKFGNFFRHLEEMVFGEQVSILDDRVL